MQSALQVQCWKPQHDATEIAPGTGACWRKLDTHKTTTYVLGAYSSFAAQARSTLQTEIYTSYKSIRQCGYAHASDKLHRGRGAWTAQQPHSLPRPPSHPFPLLFPLPPLTLPLSEVQCLYGGNGPAVSSLVVRAAWPKCQSHPSVCRWAAGGQPCWRTPVVGSQLPTTQPPAGLHRPTLLLAGPKTGSGVLRGEPGSTTLQGFAFLRHLVGVWELSFSSLSLSGEMSVCGERGRVWGRERDWKKSLLKERGRDFGVAGEQVGGRD